MTDQKVLANRVELDVAHHQAAYRTGAAAHDGQALDDILDETNTVSDVRADSAYRLAETEAKLAEGGLRSRIHRKAYRNRLLSKREQQGNRTRSKVRARVEHVFGVQANDMGGTLLRSIGIARAKSRIGLKNRTYTMRRAVHLDGLAAARAPS